MFFFRKSTIHEICHSRTPELIYITYSLNLPTYTVLVRVDTNMMIECELNFHFHANSIIIQTYTHTQLQPTHWLLISHVSGFTAKIPTLPPLPWHANYGFCNVL